MLKPAAIRKALFDQELAFGPPQQCVDTAHASFAALVQYIPEAFPDLLAEIFHAFCLVEQRIPVQVERGMLFRFPLEGLQVVFEGRSVNRKVDGQQIGVGQPPAQPAP